MKISNYVTAAAVVAGLIAVSACANTVRGAGKDVKGTVNAVEDTVD